MIIMVELQLLHLVLLLQLHFQTMIVRIFTVQWVILNIMHHCHQHHRHHHHHHLLNCQTQKLVQNQQPLHLIPNLLHHPHPRHLHPHFFLHLLLLQAQYQLHRLLNHHHHHYHHLFNLQVHLQLQQHHHHHLLLHQWKRSINVKYVVNTFVGIFQDIYELI